jgi:hypothetical protein
MSPEKDLIVSQPFSRVLAAELAEVDKRRKVLQNPALKRQFELADLLTRRKALQAAALDAPIATERAISAGGPGPTNGTAAIDHAALKEITDQKEQRLAALRMHTSGLAISGGGIRSATFALGMLQGLAELNLLKRFDYISTVSGGGYIGGWLAAWTKREGDVENVARQLCYKREDQSKARRLPLPSGADGVVDEEPEPVHHLRAYSSYLAPRSGFFTPDTWSLLAIYARNLLINFLILLPATVFVVTLVRLAVLFFAVPSLSFVGGSSGMVFWLVIGVSFVFLFALALVFNMIGMELFKLQEARSSKKSRRSGVQKMPAEIQWISRTTLAVLVAVAVIDAILARAWLLDLVKRPWALPLIAALAVILGFSAVYYTVAQRNLVKKTTKPPPIAIYRLLWLVIVPLIVSAVLSCWLFSIDPMRVKTEHVVVSNGVIIKQDPGADVFLADASNFKTRLQALGYKALIAPFDPPAILADQAPTGTTDEMYDQNALNGWQVGKFYWWPALMVIGFFAFMHGAAHLFINWVVLFRLLADQGYVEKSPPFSLSRVGMALTLAVVPFFSGALGGLLFFILVVDGLWSWHHQPHALVTFGPPLALLLFTVSAALEIGLLGHRLEEDEREWWARVGALALLAATIWALFFFAVLYVPWLIEFAGDDLRQRWLKGGLTLGWLMTSIGGAVAGRSSSTGNNKRDTSKLMEALAQVAPWVFVIGLLAGISLLVSEVVDVPLAQPGGFHNHWAEVDLATLPSLAALSMGSGLFALLMSSLVDVNLFSLHNMYANRLIRAYMGASRRKKAWENRWGKGTRPVDRCGAPTQSKGGNREENPISGFDFDDDIPLIELRTARRSRKPHLPAYWGPFPLINTALNLVATRELDWQERKAEAFVLSPLYCGSESTGYQLLPDDFRRGNMTLGRAVAVSGAAADPNMGHHTSIAVAALMTVFNTRLGWWIENPSRPRRSWEKDASAQWAAESPSFGGLILKELSGQTDSVGRWVHLSDGGHFENLAAYELIRRRCRYIVISDGGCDPNFQCEDLANLIRKCRTDFGIRIEIDTAPIQKTAADGSSRWHCAIGKIRYDDVDGGEVPGMLVYVKSSMTGDEPPDLQQYARSDSTFPHQTTADQFFDETQFESYRALGYHVAHEVFSDVKGESLGDLQRTNAAVFSRVRNRWFPAPAELEANFHRVAEAFERLQQTMRSDENLRAFTHDLYPELKPTPTEFKADPDDRACAELHAVNQVVLLMEKAWITVKLEGFPEHPMNRGWMNQFRRCASSVTVRRLWPALRGAFSQEFVRFCEQELLLPGQLPAPVEFSAVSDVHKRAYESLKTEFAREWPDFPFPATMPPAEDQRTWVILDNDPEPFAYGIVVATIVDEAACPAVREVIVWIRPAYRNMKIGQTCFRTLFPFDHSGPLTVRYPKQPAGGDKVRLDLWKFFHFNQSFRPADGDNEFLVQKRRAPGDCPVAPESQR